MIRFAPALRPSLSLVLLALFATALWVAGGASRADVYGQAVVRAGAICCLVALVLIGPRPDLRGARMVLALLAAAALMVLIELIPLPPAIWQSLPGREILAEPATLRGVAQPWRPLAIVPDGAVNAAASLLVPLAMLAMLTTMPPPERRLLPIGLLVFIAAAGLVGLLQLSGSSYQNPLINDTPGLGSGIFANRNHFSLLLAIGCLVAPVWAASNTQQSAGPWRAPVALALVALFVMLIVVSGSRAGLMLGGLALASGLLLVRHPLRRALRRSPRWVLPALLVAGVLILAALIYASVGANRALAISRFVSDDMEDMRSQALPTLQEIILRYSPVGTGAGSFDQIFRMHEPPALLDPTYFNHAHDDFLEIVLEHGAAGLLLLVAGAVGWAWASVAVWRLPPQPEVLLGRAGSLIVLLVALSSIVDYPARTPIIMALLVLAGVWLGRAALLSGGRPTASALRSGKADL